MKGGKAAVFWPLVGLLVLADCTSKQVAAERLEPEHVPHEVFVPQDGDGAPAS